LYAVTMLWERKICRKDTSVVSVQYRRGAARYKRRAQAQRRPSPRSHFSPPPPSQHHPQVRRYTRLSPTTLSPRSLLAVFIISIPTSLVNCAPNSVTSLDPYKPPSSSDRVFLFFFSFLFFLALSLHFTGCASQCSEAVSKFLHVCSFVSDYALPVTLVTLAAWLLGCLGSSNQVPRIILPFSATMFLPFASKSINSCIC
jgi:hypothetical protein